MNSARAKSFPEWHRSRSSEASVQLGALRFLLTARAFVSNSRHITAGTKEVTS